MEFKSYDRRSFLKALGLTGVGLVSSSLLFRSNAQAALDLCTKPDSKAQGKMMVGPLKYVDSSKKPAEKCANCMQFKPDAKDKKLGECNIIQGCSVKAAGWCASWSKKA